MERDYTPNAVNVLSVASDVDAEMEALEDMAMHVFNTGAHMMTTCKEGQHLIPGSEIIDPDTQIILAAAYLVVMDSSGDSFFRVVEHHSVGEDMKKIAAVTREAIEYHGKEAAGGVASWYKMTPGQKLQWQIKAMLQGVNFMNVEFQKSMDNWMADENPYLVTSDNFQKGLR